MTDFFHNLVLRGNGNLLPPEVKPAHQPYFPPASVEPLEHIEASQPSHLNANAMESGGSLPEVPRTIAQSPLPEAAQLKRRVVPPANQPAILPPASNTLAPPETRPKKLDGSPRAPEEKIVLPGQIGDQTANVRTKSAAGNIYPPDELDSSVNAQIVPTNSAQSAQLAPIADSRHETRSAIPSRINIQASQETTQPRVPSNGPAAPPPLVKTHPDQVHYPRIQDSSTSQVQFPEEANTFLGQDHSPPIHGDSPGPAQPQGHEHLPNQAKYIDGTDILKPFSSEFSLPEATSYTDRVLGRVIPLIQPILPPAPALHPSAVSRSQPSPAQPTVEVRIGSLEVRANRPQPPSTPLPKPRPQGFDAYAYLRGWDGE